MKKVILNTAVAGMVAFGGIAAAQAATTTLNPGAGQYMFKGPAVLSVAGIKANCTLSLTGNVAKKSNGAVTINVTDGSVQGGGRCNDVSLVFDPSWSTTVSQAMLPTTANPSKLVHATFNNVIVKYHFLFISGTCNSGASDVPATFTNGDPASDPSAFMFDSSIGSCSVNGTLKATKDINVIVQK